MSFNLTVKKDSKWRFKTNATGGLGVAVVSGSGGLIELETQEDGHIAVLYYGGLGVGWSVGGKLPKIPKLPKINLKGKSGAGSTTDFTSHGAVSVLGGCAKDDLDATDFQGPCIYVDGSASLFAGYGGTVLLAGISSIELLKAIGRSAIVPGVIDPAAFDGVIGSAKGLIRMWGWSAGAQIGIGASVSLGYLHLSRITDSDGTCVNNAEGFCVPA